MVTTNEISISDQAQAFPISKYAEDNKVWGEIVTSSAFLPRLQLFGANSDAAKESKIGMGRWGLQKSKDQIDDLTNQVDVYPISWRFKAMRIAVGNVLSYHNPMSDEFKKIMADSELPDSGCFYGPEFLVWIPNAKAYATLLFGSKTARRQAGPMKNLLEEKKGATLKVELIRDKKNRSWHGPVVVPCSTPFDLSPYEDMLQQATIFSNPKDSEVETVEGSTTNDRET